METASFLQLLLIGLIVAAGPLAYVWALRGAEDGPAARDVRTAGSASATGTTGAAAGRRTRKLVWVILFLTFDLILFGAFTRLTDSGLGCPDWPGCYGSSNPLAAHADIKAAEAAQPTGPVTVTKAWIEMIHRYLAMGVGVLIAALVALAWQMRHQQRQLLQSRGSGIPSLRGAAALLVFVCLVGAFGRLTVTLKLMPLVVTIHLLLAVTLLCALGVMAARLAATPPLTPDVSAPVPAAVSLLPLRGWVTLALIAVFVQIALGGWVSTNYAVLACPDFPLCHGDVIPTPADFASGYELLRPLGVRADGTHLPVEALVAIHWTHRAFALVVFSTVAWTAALVLRDPQRDTGTVQLARWLLGLLLLQLLSGISNVIFSWPVAVAVLHNGGAAALALTLALLHTRLAPRPTPALAPSAMVMS